MNKDTGRRRSQPRMGTEASPEPAEVAPCLPVTQPYAVRDIPQWEHNGD